MGVWKANKNEWEVIKNRSRLLPGNGRRVKFRKDLWCGEPTLEEAF